MTTDEINYQYSLYKTMYPTGFVLEKQLLDMLKEKNKDIAKETENIQTAEEELKLDQLLIKRTFKMFQINRKGWGKQLIGFREVINRVSVQLNSHCCVHATFIKGTGYD